MSTSAKSKAELEQVALAMMMMAGGEGTSKEEEVVGVKTRSSSTRASLQNSNNRDQQRQEPVSRNCLNKNKNGNNNHDQPTISPGAVDDEADDGSGDYEDSMLAQQDSLYEESPTDLVMVKEEVADEAIVCTINPMAFQSSPSPGPESPADSQRSTNSGNGIGINVPIRMNTDGVYMSSARRIFRPEFKKKVLDAFSNDPDCVGNQRATARKFGIHRRQVQKWLQQLSSGELTFKNLEQPSEQQDNDESYTKSNGLATNTKLAHSTRRPTSVKVTRRGAANGKSILLNQQHITRTQRRSSDPPTRAAKVSGRNRGKSMPLKGGSKSTAHFTPTLVLPSGSSKPLPRLTKGATKQNGNSSSYAYHNDINGNGSSMFMNMSTLLASAAAASNLGMPLSLDNPRNFSPRDHSPVNNNGRGSPAHSAGGSSGSSHNSNLQNALLLVDELNFLYPYSDFSLLRKALLKEEVSLEKLAHPLIRNKATEFRVNGNGALSESNQGHRRSAGLSPPLKSGSSQQDYNAQQTLDIIRQHQEYLKLLQQCGISNADLAGGLNLSELSNSGRLPAWFNPLAAAAAAGLPVPSNSGINGGKFGINGHYNENGRRKSETQDNHKFVPPRVPPAVNSGKARTVAAALAATRVQSTHHPQQIVNKNGHNGNGRQNSRPAQRRKPNGRQAARNAQPMDDELDPTSMLEVVTNIPSPSSSPRTNQFGYNGHSHHGQRNGKDDYNQGMDLTTTSSTSQTTSSAPTTTTRLISKAMNKEYSFLNELGLIRKSPETESPKMSNGYGLTHTASLENFVQNILPPRQKSPPAASSSTSSSSPPASDLSDTEKTKNMVIDAFTYDPDLSGDARAVARKFGLSARVVQKWIKESTKSSQQSSDEFIDNGLGNSMTYENNNFARSNDDDEDALNGYLHAQNLHKAMFSESNNNSGGGGVNKRKNSKPNQICDFPVENEMEFTGALDMVVPIKKRRVSSPSPTGQEA